MYLLRGEVPPICETCESELNIKHVLLECPLYYDFREQIHLSQNLKTCLGNNMEEIRKIIHFLNQPKLITKI